MNHPKPTSPEPPLIRPDAAVPAERIQVANVREILPALIDALTDALVVVDRQRRVVAANRRYLEAFGAVRVDVAGSACTETLHCPELPGNREWCAVCRVLVSRATLHQITAVPDARGALRRWEAHFNPIFGPDGAVTHVVEVWRDITDRTQLEVQLAHGERLASVGVLAAGVAHEINNPLASILAGIETLTRWLERGPLDREGLDEARETLRTLDHEVERCRDITQKLMLLGRPYEAAPQWVDLNRAVQDTVALLRFEVRKHTIDVVEDLASELPPIWAREAGVRGICMNLMINAVQAMRDGGRITLVTRSLGDRVRLVVEDTGPGIEPDLLPRIWDPFFTTKGVGEGTGLGLSITNRIVTRHGGQITVESPPGMGARFAVELPIRGSGGEG